MRSRTDWLCAAKNSGWLFLLLPLLAGCGFFPPLSGSSTSSTGGNAGDYLYVANGSNTYISGFSLGTTGDLTVLSGSPYNNGVVALSLAVNPSNTFLYAGTTNGIYEYLIGSGGVLSVQNNGSPVVQDVLATAMQVDSTGGYLLAAGLGVTAQSQAMGIYQINSSTGALTALSGSPLGLYTGSTGTAQVITPTGMLITPNNSIVYVSLGTLGVQVLSLGSGGALSTGTAATVLAPLNTSSSPSDYGLASDPNTHFLFVAEINTGLRVFSIGTNGALTEISGSPYTVGAGPSGVALDGSGKYVYVTNKGSNSISGFTLNTTSGVLSAIAGSPFGSGGLLPIAVVADNSKNFMAVINSGNNGSGGDSDMQIFSFSSTTPGQLVAAGTASTGTDPANPEAIVASQ